MSALKKQGVAWAITAAMIVLAIVIGLVKGGGHGSTAAMYIHDDAGVLSGSTENKLADIIDRCIDRGGGGIAVVTCNYGRDDLYDYALDYAEDIGLSGRDFIVVLDISGDNYWLLQGADLAFSDQDCSAYANNYMERDFARGDYDGAALSVVQALADWYDRSF